MEYTIPLCLYVSYLRALSSLSISRPLGDDDGVSVSLSLTMSNLDGAINRLIV